VVILLSRLRFVKAQQAQNVPLSHPVQLPQIGPAQLTTDRFHPKDTNTTTNHLANCHENKDPNSLDASTFKNTDKGDIAINTTTNTTDTNTLLYDLNEPPLTCFLAGGSGFFTSTKAPE
jgi:hypothetical protein